MAKKSTLKLKLLITLFITVISSQLFAFGFLVSIWAAFAGSGIVAFGGSMDDPEKIRLSNISTILFFSGSLILGIYLKPRIRGIISGLLALPAFFFAWNGLESLYSILNWSGSSLPDLVVWLRDLSLISSFVITTILVVSGKVSSRRSLGYMSLGILIGIALSVLSGFLLTFIYGTSYNPEIIPIFIAFLWTWLSTVFVVEFTSLRRS